MNFQCTAPYKAKIFGSFHNKYLKRSLISISNKKEAPPQIFWTDFANLLEALIEMYVKKYESYIGLQEKMFSWLKHA